MPPASDWSIIISVRWSPPSSQRTKPRRRRGRRRNRGGRQGGTLAGRALATTRSPTAESTKSFCGSSTSAAGTKSTASGTPCCPPRGGRFPLGWGPARKGASWTTSSNRWWTLRWTRPTP
eukprot:1195971-Prorocentrum_minimum.AAC.1